MYREEGRGRGREMGRVEGGQMAGGRDKLGGKRKRRRE